MMNKRQRAAIENPCARADDVAVVRREVVTFKGLRWSTLLSVNK